MNIKLATSLRILPCGYCHVCKAASCSQKSKDDREVLRDRHLANIKSKTRLAVSDMTWQVLCPLLLELLLLAFAQWCRAQQARRGLPASTNEIA